MKDAQKKLHLKVYFYKYLRIFFNSKGLFKIFSTFIITSLVLLATSKEAFIKYEDTKTTAFAIVCACIWIGLFNSIEIICSERESIRQEHLSGNVDYSTFLGAHMMVEFLLCMVEAVIISSLILFVYRSRLEIGESLDLARIIAMFFSVWFIVYAADVLGLMISSLVKTNKMAMTVMPFALIFQLIFSDFIFELDGWASKLSNFTIAKWGLRALGIATDINMMETSIPDDVNSFNEQSQMLISQFLSLNKQRAISDFSPENFHLLRVFFIFVIFIIIQALIARYAMGFIERDER